MTLEEIAAEWKVDGKVEIDKTMEHCCDIGVLLGKYVQMLANEKRLLQKRKNERASLKLLLTRYYRGEFTQEELQTLGYPPFQPKIKNSKHLFDYLEGDTKLHVAEDRVVTQEAKVVVLDNIVKYIHNRGYNMRLGFDYFKYVNGIDR